MRTIRKLPLSGRIALLLLSTIAFISVVVPLIPGSDAFSQDLFFHSALPMSVDPLGQVHVLGTDLLGRDLLSRIALAGRVSLTLALSAVAISAVLGTALGLVAGYLGGRADALISTVADIQLSVPRFILLIAVVAAFGPTLTSLAVTLGLTGWMVYTRVIRAETLGLREREFVEAARVIGASQARILLRHLLPNELPTVLVLASFEIGQVIILEASLSYVGLGVQAPLPAWGSMIFEAQSYLRSDPLLTIWPGLALFMVVAGSNAISQQFTFEARKT